MKKHLVLLSIMVASIALLNCKVNAQQPSTNIHVAPAPLFRDPITDGVADASFIWNREENEWWIIYSQRRANTVTDDVAYCYGNAIGIASSDDHGKTWVYRGTLDLKIDEGANTFWAPDVIFVNGLYHLYLVYFKGVRNHWGGTARIAHFTSKNLWNWKFINFLELPKQNVIDPYLFKKPNSDIWMMWYKGSDSHIYLAESKDFQHWTGSDKPVHNGSQEGPIIFKFKNYFWMITDEWHGMRVYQSTDLVNWQKKNIILNGRSQRPDDGPSGAHGDVVVFGDKAYIIYFTHPGRISHNIAPEDRDGFISLNLKRSSLEVAALCFQGDSLIAERDNKFDFWLPNLK